MNNNEFIKEAIDRYQPIIYLHSNENYLPIDFRNYINEAKLRNKKTKTIFKEEEEFNYEIFGEWITKYPHINNDDYTLYLPDGMNSEIIKDKINSPVYLDNTPIYVNVEESFNEDEQREEFYLSFIHMYAVNGSQKIFKCFSAGKHYADLESVTMCIQKSSENQPILTSMYFSRRTRGEWISPDKILYEDGHPLVFSSYNSHVSYEKPGDKLSYCKFTKDKCNKGMKWFPKNIIYLNNNEILKENRWIMFKGDFGKGGVKGLSSRKFWINPKVKKTNCCC